MVSDAAQLLGPEVGWRWRTDNGAGSWWLLDWTGLARMKTMAARLMEH